MGLAGSSCCQHPQKHPDVTESLQNPPDDDDEQGVLVMEGDVEADRKRGDARKGNKARIGGAVGDDDEGDEEHLLNHKKTKEMDKGTKELIKAAMKQDRVCAILEDAEVDAILTTMEYFQFSKGSVIVEQGKMGTTFFVTHSGTLEVSVNGNVVNTLMEGQAFGGLALLYNCPRTATVKALIDAGVWGANGHNFKQVLAQNAANRQADNLKFLDSIKIFDGLNQKQKDQIALAAFSESFDAGQRVATQGEALAAIYFVKKGGLAVMAGGEVKADGKFSGGKEEHHLSSGEYIGAALLSAKTRPLWENTLLADGRADGKSAKTELLCISVKDLKEILGNNLAKMLETALVNKGLRMCPVMSQFSSTQRNDIAKAIVIKDLAAGGTVEEGVRYIVVLEGTVTGMYKEEEAEVEQKRWPLLQRLLSAVDAVEDAAGASGWSEKELAWSLALVQKLSNAALWCLLTHRSTRAADSVDNDHAPKDPLAVRCKVHYPLLGVLKDGVKGWSAPVRVAMGSARREKNVFRVQLSDFVGEGLAESEVDQVDPYLKIDFDNFKVFKSDVEQNNRTPQWSFKAKFHYEICYLEKLKHRSLRIQCFNRRSQQSLGEASIDLHSIACGPSQLQLTLRDTATGEAAGLLRFTCDMRMISDFALVFQNLRVPSGLDSCDVAPLPASSLLIGCSLCEQQIQASCGSPGDVAWAGPFVISFQTCLADLLQASSLVTFQLQSDEFGHVDASATLELRKSLAKDPKDHVDFQVPLIPLSSEEAFGELEGTLIFRNLPVLAQMSGGLCVDGQVEGGFILRENLPFPRSMSHPPPPGLAVLPEVVLPAEEDMEDAWFTEALDRISMPFPWERRVTTGTAPLRPQFYFLDPRSERTTWKDPRFLPKGWEQRIDPRGQVYFQYHVTRQTTRMDPRGCPVAWDMRMSDDGEIYFAFRPAMRTTRRDPRGLPESVDPALDHWGRMYFKMHDTQSTTWDDPRAGQPEVTLQFWRQAQRKRWWKEKVRKEVEEMTRLKEVKEMSKADMEIIMFDKEPSESSV